MKRRAPARRRAKAVAAARPSWRATHEIPAGHFKARCLELMDRVRERREEYVITKYGKPVAKLVPVEEQRRDAWGWMKGTVLGYGDLISPIDIEWEANADNEPDK